MRVIINNLTVPAVVALLSISAHVAVAKNVEGVDQITKLIEGVDHKEHVERQMRRDPSKKNKKKWWGSGSSGSSHTSKWSGSSSGSSKDASTWASSSKDTSTWGSGSQGYIVRLFPSFLLSCIMNSPILNIMPMHHYDSKSTLSQPSSSPFKYPIHLELHMNSPIILNNALCVHSPMPIYMFPQSFRTYPNVFSFGHYEMPVLYPSNHFSSHLFSFDMPIKLVRIALL